MGCYREAERIDRAAFGDDHPKVATDVNNIGGVLLAKGDLEGALQCFREAERIDRAAFGDDHPAVAKDMNNIGAALRTNGTWRGHAILPEGILHWHPVVGAAGDEYA